MCVIFHSPGIRGEATRTFLSLTSPRPLSAELSAKYCLAAEHASLDIIILGVGMDVRQLIHTFTPSLLGPVIES